MGLENVALKFINYPFGETGTRLGSNLQKTIIREMNGNETSISKFSKMFDTVFTDFNPNTVFELGKKNEFLLFNRNVPDITVEAGNFGEKATDISQKILLFCNRALHAAEKALLKQIENVGQKV